MWCCLAAALAAEEGGAVPLQWTGRRVQWRSFPLASSSQCTLHTWPSATLLEHYCQHYSLVLVSLIVVPDGQCSRRRNRSERGFSLSSLSAQKLQEPQPLQQYTHTHADTIE